MIITGKVKVIKSQKDYCNINEEVVIVAKTTTPDIMVIMKYVKAIITEIDNKLCHAAIISREYDKPLLMGVEKATLKFKDGDMISINSKTKKVC